MIRMKVQFVTLLVCALTFGSATHLCAATFDDGVYRLGEVVVSGQESIVESAGNTHKVTAAEIEKRGARTLDQAINLLPGVQVRTGGDGAPRIDIRGFRTRHVKLLLNGTPFNSTYDGQFDPAVIPVENIAEIVVTTGGGSELYGPGGNAGVINIITKKGVKGMHGSVGVELADGDAQLMRATGSYGADKYDVFVSGSVYEQDYFELSDHFSATAYEDGGERENSDRRRNDAFINVGYSPTDATLVGLTFSYLGGERGKPSSIVKDDYSSLKYDREDDTEGINAQLALSHDFAGPMSFKGWAYFNKLDVLDNRYDDADYDSQTKKGAYSSDATTEISGVNVQLRYDLERFGTLTIGGMLENDEWEDEGFTIPSKSVVDYETDADFQLYSATLQYEVTPVRNLGLVAGLGCHWQDRDESSEEDYSYTLGLYYDLLEGTRLKASHARKVRFPTLRDLYDVDSGNPDLGAEVTWHYEAGIEQALPAKTMVSLTGFYIDIEDFIEKNDITGLSENFEKYEFYGVEVSAENRYFDRLLLGASYTYMSTEDKGDDSERDELQNRPEHKIVLEATYQLPWQMSVYGSAQYVAQNYYYAKQDTSDQRRLPEYVVVDFRVNKSAAGGALDLYFGINNLLDEDYEQSYGFPVAGRTMYGGVTWKF